MHYSMTFLEDLYKTLVDHLFDGSRHERAAYLLCGVSQADEEVRLLVREVLPVLPDNTLESSRRHMKIASVSFLKAMKKAHLDGTSFVFVHSHPASVPKYSEQDDREEVGLFATAYARIHHAGVHGSLVLSSPDYPVGRVWLEDGSFRPMDVVRIVGHRFRFMYTTSDTKVDLAIFDRQVRAFGKDLQSVLKRLIIGVVGAGGTGSSVAEQLIRLGAGHLLVADPQRLAASNVTRVYGSSVRDAGRPKVELIARLASSIGFGTQIETVDGAITFESVLKQFRKCDVIFGCTDDQWGRSLLNRLSIYYCIPVLDLGVRIDSENGILHSVQGRITTLYPGSACLFCRARLSAEHIRLESMSPEEAELLRREGYAPGLAEPDPAVISFTTAIAANAISQFLHRLTGFMGEDANSTEVMHLFDANRIGKNGTRPNPNCFCSDRTKWGRGDRRLFLDVTWRQE